MVQDSPSMILSNDNNYGTIRATKRARVLHDHQTFNQHVVAKFKGVVPQNNGHWGAQIYANHQRIWLGTFKSEIEAAMAYDSAAIKLRNGDSHRNFSWSDSNTQESIFQNNYSPEDVLNMIRDGSYRPKLADFLRTQSQIDKISSPMNQQTRLFHGTDSQFSCVQLFQKELTPSDVGKLNRLVIPKRFAVKYFPYISEDVDDHDDLELVFYDRNMRPWKFSHRAEDGQKLSLIDVVHGNNNGDKSCVVDGDEMQVGLELKLGQSRGEDEKELGLESSSSTHTVEEKGFRLFGVPINV
ncbi:AP2 domain-containing transcription factor family protein [Tripterygium wilfordii]|uniref:AP2 domain-containing transcription factor family protein n=1 Tax=Tripterygium wilfordii TaxID=458696 RepID=A0A7J7DQZ2_TRIWF|nr:AP2 domain-containing transcription factor family protein [Tripterygium wilfordii]